MEKEVNERPSHDGGSSSDAGRREALRKIALYGAVTGPLLLGMLKSEKAIAQTVN
jgi:hypothetical protein